MKITRSKYLSVIQTRPANKMGILIGTAAASERQSPITPPSRRVTRMIDERALESSEFHDAELSAVRTNSTGVRMTFSNASVSSPSWIQLCPVRLSNSGFSLTALHHSYFPPSVGTPFQALRTRIAATVLTVSILRSPSVRLSASAVQSAMSLTRKRTRKS